MINAATNGPGLAVLGRKAAASLARRAVSRPIAVSFAQRLGFAVRDKGCVFPGCDRPPSWCEAHHITPWARGGGTDLTNGCLLCGYHHRLIHQGDWQIIMAEDWHPQVIPPDWIDPVRTPLRNSYWHPDWQPKPRP